MINFANSYHKYVNRFLEINEAAKEAPAELIRQVEGAYRSAIQEVAQEVFSLKNDCKVIMPVSYTHLTLPTILLV